MTSEHTFPGWKLSRIKLRLVPNVAIGWLLAFLVCWPMAYCVQFISRVGDQARVERTLHDLRPLVEGVGKAYREQPAEQKFNARRPDESIHMSVRQLIRTGVVPVSFIGPSVDQPQSLFNAWGGPILNSVGPAGIRIDMIYIPNRLCSSFLEHAGSAKGIIQVALGGDNYFKPPIDSVTARAACINRTGIGFVFAASATRTEP